MDFFDGTILKVSTPKYKTVVIEASDGMRYYADLSSFSKVYCFPKNKKEWDKVVPDDHGDALVWTSGFDIHVHQVVDWAYKTEKIGGPPGNPMRHRAA